MAISSLVVVTEEGRQSEVAEALEALECVEVSSAEPAGLIVITETTSKQQDNTLWDEIGKVPGVVSVNLAYHNFEDLTEADA